MNLSSRRLSAYALVAAAFLVAVGSLVYLGGNFGGSLVAQVTSGLTQQVTGYETAVKFSTGYSSTQGKNNWSYQYRKDGDELGGGDGPFIRDREDLIGGYSNMTYVASTTRWGVAGTWPLIGKGFMHPGVTNEAVLKWTAPKAGEVKITGTVSDFNTRCGSGAKARIVKGNATLWSSIIPNDTIKRNHSVNTTVTKSEAVYFIVDNNSTSGDHLCDGTNWDPSIAYKTTVTPPTDDDVNNDLPPGTPPGDPDPGPGIVKGNIASVGKDAGGTFVQGWACHANVDQAITIDIYAGAAKGTASSTFVIKTPATNIASPAAVHTACETPNTIKHNFKYYFTPAAATAHAGKKLYLYGNSTTGAAGDKLLARSGAVSLPVVTPEPEDISDKFSVPNPVRTTVNVNVRSLPNGATLGQQALGARGVIATPPSSQNGIKAGSYYWWYTNFNTGVDGWVAEPNLALATSTPPKPQTGVVKGNIASIGTDSTGTFVSGWACQESVNKSIRLDIYAGGAKTASSSVFVVTTPATNVASPAAVHTVCKTPNAVKHNFKYYFTPAALTAHADQPIYIYGKSTSSSTPDTLLTRSGQVRLPAAEEPDTCSMASSQSESIPKGKAIITSSTAESSAAAILPADLTLETETQSQSSLPGIDTAKIYRQQASSGQSPQAGGMKTAVASGPWSSTATWGGTLPNSGNDVRIPAGVTVTLDTVAETAGLEINGVLRNGAVNASLSSKWVMVMGAGAKLEFGTAASPFTKNFTLELRGTNTGENIHGAGTKFLMAMEGGQIIMHGKPKTSWTKLSRTVASGATSVTLSESVNWEVGNKIVIAPSGRDPEQAEVRTITARSSDCKTFTLNTPLSYRHVGVQQSYSSGSQSWVLDQRAEVGLLSHNIKIQGDANSEATSFGAHVMIMKGAKGYFSSVELHRMGQKKILGRYPIHWHMHENGSNGQYFKNSSIYRSYNRAVTIHGSEGLTIERNVAYDHMGHGIFLEDAVEQNNKINYNLVMLTRKPAPGDQLLPSDNSHNEVQNRTPASFWITNPNNEFIGNVAAGTVGTGFWFIFPNSAIGLSRSSPRYSSIVPRKQNLGVFRDNVAHSNASGFDVHDGLGGSHEVGPNVPYDPPSRAVIDGFTLYSNILGLYTGAAHNPSITLTKKLVFRGVISADIFREHLRFANSDTVENSVFIADSGNKIVPVNQPRVFLASYDGPAIVRNSHLVGFNGPKKLTFGLGGGHIKHANILFDGVTSDPVRPYFSYPDYALVPYGSTQDTALEHISMDVIDKTGSLTGIPNTSIITSNPLQRTSTDIAWPNGANVYISKNSFINVKVEVGGANNMKVTRTGGGEDTKTYTDSFVWAVLGQNRFQFHPIVNKDFTYTLKFGHTPSTVSLLYMDGKPGDRVKIRAERADGTFAETTLVRTSAIIDGATLNLGSGGGGPQTP